MEIVSAFRCRQIGIVENVCKVEIAMHTPMGLLTTDYFMIEIDIHDTCHVEIISEKDLPGNWESFANMQNTQLLGNNFIKGYKVLVFESYSNV